MVRDSYPSLSEPATLNRSPQSGIRPRLGQWNYTLFGAPILDPTSEHTVDLAVKRYASPLATAPALPKDLQAPFVQHDVLHPKPQNLDPPQTGVPFERNDDSLNSFCRPIQADELVSGQPSAVDRRPGRKPPP